MVSDLNALHVWLFLDGPRGWRVCVRGVSYLIVSGLLPYLFRPL